MSTMRRRGQARWTPVGVVASAALVLAACASVTEGRGALGSPASSATASSSPDFPSTSATLVPSSPAPSSSAPSTSRPPLPTTAQREEVLVTVSGGDDVSNLVAVPGGFEAASWDQVGSIRFWFDPASSLTWQSIGESEYPFATAIGPPEAHGHGIRLRNMRHATFIVTGIFTGDGSGNAVAFTTGSKGWGAIKAESNGNIGPSGEPVGDDRIGLSFGFAFSQGYLVTSDCPQDRPQYQCDTHQIRKRWVWTGHDFRRV